MDAKSPADRQLGEILDAVSEVCYAVDGDWRVIFFNGGAESFFQVERDRVLGRRLWRLVPTVRDMPFGRLLVRVMMRRQPERVTHPSPMRPERTVTARVAPLSDGGIVVAIEDVTEEVEAKRAAAEHQERLNLAVSAHHIGIFDRDLASGDMVWSDEMKRIFGVRADRIEELRDLILPEDLERVRAETRAAEADGADTIHFSYRIRRSDGAVRWVEGAARYVFGPGGAPERQVGALMDVTDRKVAEQHERLLINELNHRVKNTLATVQGIAWQSFRDGEVARSAREAFEGRLAALSAAHNVLTQRNWEAASLRQIVTAAARGFCDRPDRFDMSGSPIDLAPATAVALSLAVHELATNALKYGALSVPEGTVEIRWRTTNGVLAFTWRERGGPPVVPPGRRGFGSRLLEQGLAQDLGGTVELDFKPTGLVCRLTAPLEI